MDDATSVGRGRGAPHVSDVFHGQGEGKRGRREKSRQTGSLPRSSTGHPPARPGQGPAPSEKGYPAQQGNRRSPPSGGFGGYPEQRESGYQVGSLTSKVAQQTPAEADEGRGCCVSTAKVLGIAFIVAALVAGLIGTLVYTGVMEIGLMNCGTMSPDVGLYTLLAGFCSAVVAAVVYTILTCDKCETKAPDEQIRSPEEGASDSEGALDPDDQANHLLSTSDGEATGGSGGDYLSALAGNGLLGDD